jgi:cysteine desulfurase
VIYLDSNATTQPAPEVVEAMLPYLRERWWNPSSSYRGAREVRRALEAARGEVAEWIGAESGEVVFTSCGTESINTVAASVRALWPERRRLIVGATEHAAVMESGQRWVQAGGEVVVAPVGRDGVIDLAALEVLLGSGVTGLVSIMWANNETGVIAPMREVVAMAHAAGALVHADAVQAVGKVAVDVREVPVDFLSLSGHKVHAAKGVGALYVSRRARFQALLVGGGQEEGRRSGTENVAGVVGLGVAARLMREQDGAAVAALRDAFEEAVRERLPDTLVNGSLEHRLGTTSSLTFPGVDAAGLLILLDKAGVCCSAGSACHTASLHPSPVLEAMGYDATHAGSTVRFSFCRFNTKEEVRQAVGEVVAGVRKLRAMKGEGEILSSP